MYSTCLFCHAPLGANEMLEHFPVGRRIAFDAARGRLWVVCPSCSQWSLSPLDERWEAVEDADDSIARRSCASRRIRSGSRGCAMARTSCGSASRCVLSSRRGDTGRGSVRAGASNSGGESRQAPRRRGTAWRVRSWGASPSVACGSHGARRASRTARSTSAGSSRTSRCRGARSR